MMRMLSFLAFIGLCIYSFCLWCLCRTAAEADRKMEELMKKKDK